MIGNPIWHESAPCPCHAFVVMGRVTEPVAAQKTRDETIGDAATRNSTKVDVPEDVVITRFHIDGSGVHAYSDRTWSNPTGEGWTVSQPAGPQSTKLHHVATIEEAISLARILAVADRVEWPRPKTGATR
jgi:hypothetical protein